MELEHQTRMNSSEIAALWSAYQNNSMAICVLKYFLANVEDGEIKGVLSFALEISEKSVGRIKEIFVKNKQPIPFGFSAEDVNLGAPRLYSDAFYLYYIKSMSKVGLSVYGIALTTAAQSDVREYFSRVLNLSTELYNRIAEVLLQKGLYVRAPYVSTPNNVEYIEKQNYLGGLLNFNSRPLNIIELSHVSSNIETNLIGQTLLEGFAQVANDERVRKHCYRGKEIAKKHVNILSSILSDDDIEASTTWDLVVTNSTTAPFSDKLIVLHVNILIGSGISNYATASAASLRMDLSAAYTRLLVEVADYALDGTKLMIDNRWLEQPPQLVDHNKLANR